jgi:hypothetical protein
MNMANLTNVHLNPSMSTLNHHVYLNLNTSREAIDILLEEGGTSFCNYVDWLGLSDEPDLIVLSSKHHYYYDPEEINNTKTIINIKELNQIRQIKPFLNSCLNFLPEKSNFIGCFIDNEKNNGYELRNLSDSYSGKRNEDDLENGIVSRFPFINMLYSIIDSNTIRYLSRKEISSLLKEFNFEVMDMTEYNGLTFFHSQKTGINYE